MSRKSQAAHVQDNLRTLLAQFDSVAAFCRATDINRQQFNKYLAGLHSPSSRTISALAEYFSLSPTDFVLPNAAFATKLKPTQAKQIAPHSSTQLTRFAELAAQSLNELKPFLGTYFRYHFSSIYSGRIVRAVTVIYRNGPVVEYMTLERFPLQDGERYSFMYSGICYMLGQRVFMVDYERRQRNEMTMGIFMPQHRTPIKYLYGLLSGVASSTFRQPFSSRVILERRSDDTSIQLSKLRLATLLDPNSSEISPAVSRFFENSENKVIFGQE